MRYIAKFKTGTENILNNMGGEFEIVQETDKFVIFDLEDEMTASQEQNLDTNPDVIEYEVYSDNITLHFTIDLKEVSEKIEDKVDDLRKRFPDEDGMEDKKEQIEERMLDELKEDYEDYCFQSATWNKYDSCYEINYTRELDFFCDCGEFSYGWMTSFCPKCAEKKFSEDKRIKAFWF